jgi:arogenate dehydrogenase (NADP+)
MKIGIVGLGLIGGSLGLDFRSLGHQVLGVSRQPQTCAMAIERGAVDQAATSPELLAEAEVIFLCTPLGVMPSTVKQLIPHLNPSAILTDVGSVKANVISALAPLWPNFMGGHPMAQRPPPPRRPKRLSQSWFKPWAVTCLFANPLPTTRPSP